MPVCLRPNWKKILNLPFSAIIAAAASIAVIHNHPSGDPTPSEADVKVTRDLIRAGQLLKLELVDHVVIGHGKHSSLRELGYFYA